MSLNGLIARTAAIAQVRHFLSSHGFAELEPQLLAPADTLEPNLYPFQVGESYLSTSPEAFLKQAIAAGFGNCFAIAHVFRHLEGEGRLHSPEFIMAEWYQAGATYRSMISLTQQLVNAVLSLSTQPWPILSWKTLWQQTFSTPLDDVIDDKSMVQFARQLDLTTTNATWEQLFTQITDIYVVPHFPPHPFFLIDYPAKISPLAQPVDNNPNYAERFELFIHGIELANGNTERFDAAAIQTVMVSEQRLRPHPSPLHQPLLRALKRLEGQTWSGVGLGIDRLAMLASKATHIRQVQTLK